MAAQRTPHQIALNRLRGSLVTSLWGDYYDLAYGSSVHQDFQVRLDNFRNGAYRDQWTLEVTHIPTKARWGSQVSLDTKALEVASESTAQMMLEDAILRLARQVAPHLYHLDPRIGTMFTGVNGDPLPSCPLFDRIDGAGYRQEQALRNLTTKTAGLLALTSKTPSEIESAVKIDVPHSCPFCRESLLFPVSGKAVVWGGGALCWTHKECLPAPTRNRATPKFSTTAHQ